MTTLPALRAARDAADTRWHDAAVAAREAELAVRAASDDEREAAQMALDAAMSAERDAEGAYIAAAGAHLDALHATYPPGREDEAAVKAEALREAADEERAARQDYYTDPLGDAARAASQAAEGRLRERADRIESTEARP